MTLPILSKIQFENPYRIPTAPVKKKLSIIKDLLPLEDENVYTFASDISTNFKEDNILPRNFYWITDDLLNGYRVGRMPLTNETICSILVNESEATYESLRRITPKILEKVTPRHFFSATARFFYPEYFEEMRNQ